MNLIILPKVKVCACGKIYYRIPKTAKLHKSIGAFTGYWWDCTCHSTLFLPKDKVEPWQVAKAA